MSNTLFDKAQAEARKAMSQPMHAPTTREQRNYINNRCIDPKQPFTLHYEATDGTNYKYLRLAGDNEIEVTKKDRIGNITQTTYPFVDPEHANKRMIQISREIMQDKQPREGR